MDKISIEQVRRLPQRFTVSLLLWLVFLFSGMLLIYIIRPPVNQFRGTKASHSNQSQLAKNNKNCTSNPTPVFTAEFTDFDNLKQTAPIGAIIAGSPGRAYVMVKGDASNRVMTPLYAPTDAKIISLVFAKRDPNNPTAPGEYRLELQISCEVTFNFDHMDEVSDKIKPNAPTTPSDRSNDLKYVSIPVKAGELVGYSNGTDLAGSFDLFLLNSTKTAPHINPNRWRWEQTVTADCPYNYYTDLLKSKYYSIMRAHDGRALTSVDCGNPSHDVAGTVSGGWFQDKSSDTNGNWLEIGNQNGKVEINLRQNGFGVFSIRDYQSKIMPEGIRQGASICYADANKWLYLRLDEDTRLLVVKGTGTCPTAFPSSNIEFWER